MTTPLEPDVLAFAADPPPRRRSRTPLVLTVAVVVALTLAGGAYAGMRLLHASGRQPEQAVPSSLAAFVRLDLDPGLAQGTKLAALLGKFPADGRSTQARVHDIEESLLGKQSAIDFKTDVAPWFADRFGVGVWQDADRRPVPVLALASADDAKAKARLAAAQSRAGTDRLGYAVDGGYALVVSTARGSQADVDALSGQARHETLAASAPFRDAVDALPADQVALAWADLSRIGQVLRGVTRLGLVPAGAADPFGLDSLTGYAIVGGQAVDNGVELRLRVSSRTAPAAGSADARPVLDGLPGNALVALATAGNPAVRQFADQLGRSLGGLFAVPGKRPIEPDHGRGAAQQMAQAVVGILTSKMLTLAVTGLSGTLPAALLTADLDDALRANATVETLRSLPPGLGITATQQGTAVQLKTSGYAPQGRLADVPLYREAMAGTPQHPTTCFYVDVQRYLDADRSTTAADRRDLAPVRAVAGAFGDDHGTQVGLVRIVIA